DARIVADDDVVAVFAGEGVAGADAGGGVGHIRAAGAADDDVIAAAARDRIGAAEIGIGGEQVVGVGGAVGVDDGAVVAEQDVGGIVGRAVSMTAADDLVVACAADGGVGVVAAVDKVIAADGRI